MYKSKNINLCFNHNETLLLKDIVCYLKAKQIPFQNTAPAIASNLTKYRQEKRAYGVCPYYPDITIHIASFYYHSLLIKIKKKTYIKAKETYWFEKLNQLGYFCCWIDNILDFYALLNMYLSNKIITLNLKYQFEYVN